MTARCVHVWLFRMEIDALFTRADTEIRRVAPLCVSAIPLHCPRTLARPCRTLRRTSSARSLVFHGRAQDTVEPRLIAPPIPFEPAKHIRIKLHRHVLFHRRPGRSRLLEKRVIQRWDLRIVDVPLPEPGQSRDVAFQRWSPHVGSPFSKRGCDVASRRVS